MDFDQNNNYSPPPSPTPPIPPPVLVAPPPEKPKKRTGWRIFWTLFITLSVLANFMLFFMLIGMSMFFAVGQKGLFTEEVIREGPRTSKIAVINLEGLINDTKSRDIHKQLKNAADDEYIKGLIIRVNTPGGLVSSSDQINNEIRKWRTQTQKPVVAFMESIAASGGYYASVACDKIVAEPTAITGSVGVIMNYFVLQQLLEEKLGIEPVVVKSGEKKDWPSSFTPPDDRQLQYLQDKLISPAYERFLHVVAAGRKSLTLDQVRLLADGSIYPADEALAENLIDAVGYLDDAIDHILSLAGIQQAQVVEYQKPFSLSSLLSVKSRSLFNIDRDALHEFTTPQLLYLWTPYD